VRSVTVSCMAVITCYYLVKVMCQAQVVEAVCDCKKVSNIMCRYVYDMFLYQISCVY
jgi:hypothetical protein